MQNIEFKSELRDISLARPIVKRLGATHIATLEQTDTYFRIASGRLKKRECVGEPTEWIRYDRPNRPGARMSTFTLYSEQQALERFGTEPLPIWLTVKKTRELYMLGATRIHLDVVEDLGTFLEFEALVSRSNPVAKAHESVARLREALGPVLGEPISASYSDMLAKELEMDAFDSA